MLAVAPLLAGVYGGLQRRAVIGDMVDLQAFAAGFIFTALPAAALSVTLFSALWQMRRALHHRSR